ncbi:MAG: hypothetical protein VW268_01500 [Rhodospirillaceae bacterium]
MSKRRLTTARRSAAGTGDPQYSAFYDQSDHPRDLMADGRAPDDALALVDKEWAFFSAPPNRARLAPLLR